MELCPYCKSPMFARLESPAGDSFVLTCVDTSKNPPAFLPTAGFPVEVWGCVNCKGITLRNSTIAIDQKKLAELIGQQKSSQQ